MAVASGVLRYLLLAIVSVWAKAGRLMAAAKSRSGIFILLAFGVLYNLSTAVGKKSKQVAEKSN